MQKLVPLAIRRSPIWKKGRLYYNRVKNYAMRIQRRNAWFSRVFEIAKHRLFIVRFGDGHRAYAQTCEYTRADRYPTVFSGVQRLASERGNPASKILSFGCSTGAECFTLRTYFPDTEIVGLDINRKSLGFARDANSDSRIRFLESSPAIVRENGPYDLIFANSVFCRWPLSDHVSDLSRYYPFSRFEEAIGDLDASLNVGGMLVVINPNYDFRDCDVSRRYEVIEEDFAVYPKSNPIFDRRGRKLEQLPSVHSVFVKLR
jgi:hypothetical protein